VHGWSDDELPKKRIRSINDFERLLTEQNQTHILKFYLHVSVDEQQERLQERIHNPAKMWKYNEKDFTEAKLRDKYRDMYEDCFEFCNEVPWIIVPSDQNWYKEYIVASRFYELLKSLHMQFPPLKK
jgi:polyphosphate kinase 2 (PPK2 family)